MNEIVEEFMASMRAFGQCDQVSVRLVYRPDDPVAVHMTVADEECAQEWVFARSLLADAYATGVSGLGAVRVCRVDLMGECLLWVYLDGVGHTASLALPGDRVARWLTAAERLVPAGVERVDGDWLSWRWATSRPAGRVVTTAGAPRPRPRLRAAGALVFTRPGRARSRRRSHDDPVERPPRTSPARSRLTVTRPADDEGDEQTGPLG